MQSERVILHDARPYKGGKSDRQWYESFINICKKTEDKNVLREMLIPNKIFWDRPKNSGKK